MNTLHMRNRYEHTTKLLMKLLQSQASSTFIILSFTQPHLLEAAQTTQNTPSNPSTVSILYTILTANNSIFVRAWKGVSQFRTESFIHPSKKRS